MLKSKTSKSGRVKRNWYSIVQSQPRSYSPTPNEKHDRYRYLHRAWYRPRPQYMSNWGHIQQSPVVGVITCSHHQQLVYAQHLCALRAHGMCEEALNKYWGRWSVQISATRQVDGGDSHLLLTDNIWRCSPAAESAADSRLRNYRRSQTCAVKPMTVCSIVTTSYIIFTIGGVATLLPEVPKTQSVTLCSQ